MTAGEMWTWASDRPLYYKLPAYSRKSYLYKNMKTRQETLDDYMLRTNVTFESRDRVLDLLYNRDFDIQQYLIELFNDFANLAEKAEKPVDKFNFEQKKRLVGTILEQFYV